LSILSEFCGKWTSKISEDGASRRFCGILEIPYDLKSAGRCRTFLQFVADAEDFAFNWQIIVILAPVLLFQPGLGKIKSIEVDALTTINQVEPIYVTFAVPEAQLKSVSKGQEVMVSTDDDSTPPLTGQLTFIDNTVDSTTGTIRLKATFPNSDRKLWPGEFVHVTLRLQVRPNALVVPNQVVQTGQDGTYAFVVKDDRTVESRPVVTGTRVGDDLVIEKGLQVGETVVTEGQLRLAPGSRVMLASDSRGGQGGQRFGAGNGGRSYGGRQAAAP
jgi:multidrug efflux pump subunit AcrA (membrane-fusion protein)